MSDYPDVILMVECPDCGRATSSDQENFQLQVGELECPWCEATKGPDDAVARYEKVEVEGESS